MTGRDAGQFVFFMNLFFMTMYACDQIYAVINRQTQSAFDWSEAAINQQVYHDGIFCRPF